ncbi:MAG: ACP phosphodiesterase [Rhodocyclaceae bacterium]
MNFLAHTYLAGPHEDARLGGLLGDFVKGPLDGPTLAHLPASVRAGIGLHRHIDSYLDTLPAFVASRARVAARYRRVAGIMIDVFYDHFLARHWARFSDEPLEDFAAGVYDMLDARADLLPPTLARLRHYMREDDWLVSYRDLETPGAVLARMARRLSRPDLLAGAGGELESHYAGLEADFFAAMADLTPETTLWRRQAGL